MSHDTQRQEDGLLSEENIMLRYIFVLMVVLVVPVTEAFASEIPDLTGTWMVKVEGVKLQKNFGPAPHNVDFSVPKTGRYQVDLTVTIDDQKGYGFFGTKAGAKASEPISGVVDYDNTHVFIVDEDGTHTCSLMSPVQIHCIYLEVNAVNSIASRQLWTRKK